MTQFLRQASLRIGPDGGNAKLLSGLRISFNANKSMDSTPNKCSIQIYNLSQETRDFIPNEDDVNGIAFLFAGYKNDNTERLVFAGNISSVSHQLIPPDIITNITLEDGITNYKNTKFSKSYTDGTDALDILNDILNEFPAAKKSKTVQAFNKVYANGWAHSGNARDALDKITKDLDLEWSFQNNELKLVMKNQTTEESVVLLTPETGLIGSPERMQNSVRKSQNKSAKIQPGWLVTSLLQPLLEPGNRMVLQSRQIENLTTFRINRVTHTGDTHSADWTTKSEVTELDTNPPASLGVI